MVDTSSSSYSGEDGGCILGYHKTIQSPEISSEEEEQDMANCLIMLAHSVSPVKKDRLKIRSVTEMAAAGANSGCQTYECKTCNRTFPSFQALGGHRASHKKPKLTVHDDNNINQPKLVVLYEENKTVTNKYCSPAKPDYSIQTGCKTSQAKVHQCLICGSEFLSGQALGGHMRRHRTAPPPKLPSSELNGKSPVLCLDLNLPPPEVVFSDAAMVDCHY